jgi:tetratricopeptide (TPR) repeat protein
MRWGLLAASIVASTVVFGAGRGRAETTAREKQEARDHFKKGERLYRIAEYEAALTEFKAGFVMLGDPVFIYNIAQCHRQLGRTTEAIDFYERYLRASPEAGNRAEVERRLRDLRASQATASPSRPPSEPPLVPPPPIATASAAVPAPSTDPVNLHDVARESSAGPPPIYQRWWFWAGAAAAVAIVAVVAVGASGSDPSDCAGVMTCYPIGPE